MSKKMDALESVAKNIGMGILKKAKKETPKTTKLDVLDYIYQALNAKAIKGDKVIQAVEYDGDNHDGTVQIILKDGTAWFLSSEDIQNAEEFDD